MPKPLATTLPDGTPVPPAVAGNDELQDILASPGGRAELGKAMQTARREGRGPEHAARAAQAATASQQAAGSLYDGDPHNAAGETTKADTRFRNGRTVRIRPQGQLRDGGMGDCRGTIHGTPYRDADTGEVKHPVATESGEIVGVPEHALDVPTVHRRRGLSMVVPRGCGFHTHTLITGVNPRACGPHCNPDVGKHCIETHQSLGDRCSA